MQPVAEPYRRSTWGLGAFAVAGLAALLLARFPGVPRDLRRALELGGLLVASIAALLFLGVWALGRSLRGALAAMRAGEVFGSWQTSEPPQVPVDVGAGIGVVGGRLVAYATLHQRVVRVELARDRGELRVHGVYNNGHGDTAFARGLPYAPAFVDDVHRCGARLAAHHGVAFEVTGAST